MKILTKYSTKGRSRSKTFYREMSEKLRRVGKLTSQRETANTNFEFTANMADVHFERLQLNVFRVSYVWQEWFSGNLLIVYQSFVWSSRDRISDWQDFDRSAALTGLLYMENLSWTTVDNGGEWAVLHTVFLFGSFPKLPRMTGGSFVTLPSGHVWSPMSTISAVPFRSSTSRCKTNGMGTLIT